MTFTLYGQLVSGKNAVQHTRTGQHYAKPQFKNWRADAMYQVLAERVVPPKPITERVSLYVQYTPGDLRTRDVTGMMDALFHLFVYTGILKDDGLIRDVRWVELPLDRHSPRVEIMLEPIE